MASLAVSARSRGRSVPPKRIGSEEPRVFTHPLRKLTARTSLGFSVIEFAETVLEIDLLPWQRWLLIHMLELLPDNSLRFRTVVVLVARQNGKSTLSIVLALWFMYVYHSKLILGTAQDLDTAEEVWQHAVDLVTETDEDDVPIRPDLYELHSRVVLVNGKKSLELKTGERYKVKAANRRAGRGLSGDLVLLDELREHQSWDAWGAITKTTMARAMALILALSNAGDASSIVLRYLRQMAHAALGDPDGINDDADLTEIPAEDEDLEQDEDTLAIFEWSAPPGCSVWDRDGWAMANPSLGHTITERTVSSAAKTDPEWVFRTEVLCQWSDGSLEGPFPSGTWDAGRGRSQIAEDSPVVAAVDVSWNRSWAYIAVSGLTEAGDTHTEVIAQSAGTDWVVGWFTDQRHPHRAKMTVALQANGAPVSSLADPLEDAGITVLPWRGPDLGKACGAYYDLVKQGRLKHLPQPVLDLAAATAVPKPAGDAWFWDRKNSPHDAAPLVASTAAVWGLSQYEPPKKPPASPLADTGAGHIESDSFDSVSF